MLKCASYFRWINQSYSNCMCKSFAGLMPGGADGSRRTAVTPWWGRTAAAFGRYKAGKVYDWGESRSVWCLRRRSAAPCQKGSWLTLVLESFLLKKQRGNQYWPTCCWRTAQTWVSEESVTSESKQLGIPFRGTKIEGNSWNSVPNHSAKEKTTQKKMRQPKILKIMSEKTTLEIRTNHFACFVKLDPDPLLKFRTKWSFTGYQFSLPCIFILRLCN